MRYLKKYWLEILVFGIVLAVFLIDAAPGMTWIDTNSDGVHLTFASKYLYPAHKGSAPLYLLLGHLILNIPFGTEFWRMVLISVFGSFGGAILIYLIIRHHLKNISHNRLYALLGVVLFSGSALVLSQTVIAKYYSLVTFFGLLAYYLVLKEKWKSSVAAIGAGIATHPIIVFTAIPLLIFNFKQYWNWKRALVIVPLLMFYLYVPIVAHLNNPPNMWGNLTPRSQILDTISTASMLSGTLAIYDFPKRVLDTIGLLGLSLGFGLIVIILYLVNTKRWWRNQLFWMFALPIIYFSSDLAPQTYVYLFPTIAFGSIIAAIYLSQNKKWLSIVTAIIAVGLFAYNANYFDIGRTLDKNLSANNFYHNELPKIPDGEMLMPQYGWEWAMIYSYNKNEHRNIIPIAVDTVVSTAYRNALANDGVKFADVGVADKNNLLQKQNELARSIVELNDDVWTTMSTTPETYGSKVVKTNGDTSLVVKIPPQPPGEWHFKPSNPYNMITGAIEIKEWNFITMSNQNMFYVSIIALGGAVFVFSFASLFRKKRE